MWELDVDGYQIAREHTFDVDDELDWTIVHAVHADTVCV
jgi:hypothetical protein